MHVLTKIFVVLVSLLAVLLVPLVVVYAYNEDGYKAKFEAAQAQAAAARAERDSVATRHAADSTRLKTANDELQRAIEGFQKQLTEAGATVRRLQSEVAAEQGMTSRFEADLATLAVTLQSAQQMNDMLLGEARTLRTDVVGLERQKTDLDEAFRDVSAQLDVAVQARRMLQEELQRVKDELASARSLVGEAVALGFDPSRDRVSTGSLIEGIAPDRNMTARVINVSRSNDENLAEIDVGTRDGVKEGWIMKCGRGPQFTGRLRIIEVDLNRATGLITLEDALVGRTVKIGDEAVARAGEF